MIQGVSIAFRDALITDPVGRAVRSTSRLLKSDRIRFTVHVTLLLARAAGLPSGSPSSSGSPRSTTAWHADACLKLEESRSVMTLEKCVGVAAECDSGRVCTVRFKK
jgi:hypothetical protein